jgi:hypothetical protein
MPRSKEFLLEQIARAQRFAQAMNTDADRKRFEQMAAAYQSELAALGATEDRPSAAPIASEPAVPADEAATAQPEAGGSDAPAPAPSSTAEQKPTTD